MSTTREPGWYPDPEAPATRLAEWDGEAWTGRQRPTGYAVQPAGPVPVAEEPTGDDGEVFAGAPAPTGGRAGARRRWRLAVVATAVVALVCAVALVLGVVAG